MAEAPLQLVRFEDQSQDVDPSPAVSSCLDPCSAHHAVYVDAAGTIRYMYMDNSNRSVVQLASFAIHFCSTSSDPGGSSGYGGIPAAAAAAAAAHSSQPPPQRLKDALQDFALIPNMPGEVLLVQRDSCRVLHAALPRQLGQAAPLSIFGTHQAAVKRIVSNGNITISGDASGQLKMWRMRDAQLLDTHDAAATTAITSLCFIGPLLVAAGTSGGQVTVLDLATHRMLAVHRWQAGPGPATVLASYSQQQQLAAVATSAAYPRGPDGGGLLPGAGSAAGSVVATPLLCVGSSSGWLRLYSPEAVGQRNWRLLHSRDTLQGVAAAAFSPWGDTLAVGSCAAQLLSTRAVAVAAAGQQPGTLSLYELSNDPHGSSGLAGAGAGLGLRLYHQWTLRGPPVAVAFLASCRQQWLDGKRLAALQALDVLAVPTTPQPLLLAATKPMQVAQPRQDPQQPPLAPAAVGRMQGAASAAAPAAAAAAGGSPWAAGTSGDAHPLPGSASSNRPGLERLPAASGAASSSRPGTATIHPAQGDVTPDLAERGLDRVLSAVAGAVPLSDSPLHAALEAYAAADPPAKPGDEPASAAAAASGEEDIEALAQVQSSAPAAAATAAAPAPQTAAAASPGAQPDSAGVASSLAAAAVPAAVAPGLPAPGSSAYGIWRPSTLPASRRWQEAGGSSLTAERSREELHARLQQEEARFRQQQQLQQVEETRIRQQQQEEGEAAAAAAAHAQLSPSARAAGADQELPSSSTFVHQGLKPSASPAASPSAGQPQQVLSEPAASMTAGSGAVASTWSAAGSIGLASQASSASPRTRRSKGVVTWEESPTAAAASSRSAAPAAATVTNSAVSSSGPVPLPMHPAAAAGGESVQTWPYRHMQTAAAASVADEEEPQPRALPAQLTASSPARRRPPAPVHSATSGSTVTLVRPQAGGGHLLQSGGAGGAGVQGRPAAAARAAVTHIPVGQEEEDGGELLPELRLGRPYQPSVPPPAHHHQQPPTHGHPRVQQQRRAAGSDKMGLRRGSSAAARGQQGLQEAAVAEAAGYRSSGALAEPGLNSTVLLQRRIQSLEAAPHIPLGPSSAAVRKLAAQRTGNAPLDAALFEVEPLRDITTPLRAAKLIGKQVDQRWVDSRRLRPLMSDLWDPEEWQTEEADTRCLVLPRQPDLVQVARQLLALR